MAIKSHVLKRFLVLSLEQCMPTLWLMSHADTFLNKLSLTQILLQFLLIFAMLIGVCTMVRLSHSSKVLENKVFLGKGGYPQGTQWRNFSPKDSTIYNSTNFYIFSSRKWVQGVRKLRYQSPSHYYIHYARNLTLEVWITKEATKR